VYLLSAPSVCGYITGSVFSNIKTRSTIKQFLINSFYSRQQNASRILAIV